MADKSRVAVLTGGPSCEHDVSVEGGKEILCAFERLGYEAFPVFVSRAGTWATHPDSLKEQADVAFIAMKGQYGEDGTLQGVLGSRGISFTGSDVLPSALGMHKALSSNLFKASGFSVPKFIECRAYGDPDTSELFHLGFPLIVKPADRGSSLGLGIVRSIDDVGDAIDHASSFSRNIMLQEFIPGREVTVGVIELDGVAVSLPPVGIISNTGDLYDHAAKYAPRGSDHIIPAALTPKEDAAVRFAARKIHGLIGASGYSRSDMRVTDDGCVYVLEVNTLPDMTPRSSFLRAARVEGMDLGDVLEAVISAARRKDTA